jgi:hypothetical protein
MKKIPLKWKLFLVFSYLQLLLFSVTILFNIYRILFYKFGVKSVALILACCLIICLNHFLTITTVHRFFPNTPVPKSRRRLTGITGILTSVLLLMFILGLIVVMLEKPENLNNYSLYITVLSLFLVICLSGIYTLIMQLGIFKFLDRNHAIEMNSLIDSIGTENNL